MSLDFKLSELHKSSLPILEYVRDVAHAFPEQPELSIRIATLLANLTDGEVTMDCLKEIVSLLKGHDDLVERFSGLVLGEGKLEVVTSEGGSRIVTVCPEDGGLRLTLWSSDDVVETEGVVKTPTSKQGGRPPKNAEKPRQEGNVSKKKRGRPAKKDGSVPPMGVNDGQKPAKKRRGRPRKNAQVTPQDNAITDGETGNAAMMNDGGKNGDVITMDSNSLKPTLVDGSSNDQKLKAPKRRRGRPRKMNHAGPRQPTGTESEPPQPAESQDGPPQATGGGEGRGNPARRGRGRPRKQPPALNQQPLVADSSADGGPSVVKRGRGRPRKHKGTGSEIVVDAIASVTVTPADEIA